MKGKLYMIPVPISEEGVHTLSPEIAIHCGRIKHFFVEHLREARRFLKSVDKSIDIDSCSFSEMNEHQVPDIALLLRWLREGLEIGVLSDAGCPGIADPGAILAEAAQQKGFRVIPLVGPSSVLLALMASGMNGQSFAFNGYLPVKEPGRAKRIKELESRSAIENQTQLFIETPYRNNQLLKDLIKTCKGETRLCIALDITAPNENIRTRTIREWEKENPELPKQPGIFLLMA
ncbi:SAM-dependent methyltransferase [Rurimicrobium arvi]|uniref:SAM-dependent methyltransferase n=1 Tax=Rurimicrobium arvi TaxID=2049916 RepID=A0ABP8MF23_9BACT